MIRAEKLLKRYGTGELSLTVLKSINITIEDGEFVAIIGPSGAGKSTLLYQLSLLDDPTSGEVFVDEKPTTIMDQAERTEFRLNNLGYVFQDYALLPELTAVENVLLPMMMQGSSLHASKEMASAALKKIGLGDKLNNLPSALSGGQQQRVSIARAIAHHPSILFADEPTANLDSENAHIVLDAFVDLHNEGQTIVMVTHEEEFAERAKRIITLRDGMIVSDKKTG
jgi:putative ABC transport system ATP-binding protein